MTKLNNKVKALIISVLAVLAIALGIFAFVFMPKAETQTVSAASKVNCGPVTLTIAPETTPYKLSSTTEVNLKLNITNSNPKGVGGVTVNVNYDSSKFTYKGFTPVSGYTDNAVSDRSSGSSGEVMCLVGGPSDIAGNFTAVTLTFTVVKANVTDDANGYAFTLSNDADLEIMTNDTRNGIFTPTLVNGKVVFKSDSTDNTLKDFTVGGTQLASGKIDNSAHTIDATAVELPYPSTSVTVKGTTNDTAAKINDKASGTNLTVTPNWANGKATTATATVKVKAENGDEVSYTINLKRKEPNHTATGTYEVSGGNINIGTTALSESISVNTASNKVPYNQRGNVTVTIEATNGSTLTNLKCNNGALSVSNNKYSNKPALKNGTNTITFTVTPQDGDTANAKNYTMTILVDEPQGAAITAITLYKGDDVYDETTTGTDGVWTFNKHVAWADKDASWKLKATVSGGTTKEGYHSTAKAITLNKGNNNIPVTLVSSDDNKETDNTVTIIVDDEVTDDTLDMTASLMIGGLSGTPLALSYNAKTGKYEPSRSLIAADVENLYIVAEATNEESTVDFTGSSIDENDKHLGKKGTAKLNLTNGVNNVTVTVSAADGNTKDYPVSIYYNAESGNPYITSITLEYGSKKKTVVRQNNMFHVYGIPKNVSELKFSSITNYEVESVEIYITDAAGTEIQSTSDPRQGTMGAGVDIKIRDDNGNYYSIELTVKSGAKSGTFYVDFLDSKPGDGATAFSMTGDSATVSLSSDEFSNGRAYVASFSSNKDTYDFEIFLPEGYSFRVTYGNLLKKDSSSETYEVGEYITEGGTYKIGSGLDKYVIEVVNDAGEVKTIVLSNEKGGGTNVGMLVAIIILAILFVAATVIMAVYIGKYINASKKEENNNPGYRD